MTNTEPMPGCEQAGCEQPAASMWKSGPHFAFYCRDHFGVHETARLAANRGNR